jgi:sugar phosphate isomerase/epimerase
VSTEPQHSPPFSISQVSTLAASFADDVRAYAAAGVDGIGIWELKLAEDGDDAQALEQLAASGLGSASAVPVVPSVLPLPLLPGPDDPQERIASLCAAVHRLAARSTASVPSRPRPGVRASGSRSSRSSARGSRTGRS